MPGYATLDGRVELVKRPSGGLHRACKLCGEPLHEHDRDRVTPDSGPVGTYHYRYTCADGRQPPLVGERKNAMQLLTDGGSVHDRAVAALPDHLECDGDGRIRCTDCGVTGMRPIGHTDDCEYEYTPTREWSVDQTGLDGEPHRGQATLTGGVAKDGGQE